MPLLELWLLLAGSKAKMFHRIMQFARELVKPNEGDKMSWHVQKLT